MEDIRERALSWRLENSKLAVGILADYQNVLKPMKGWPFGAPKRKVSRIPIPTIFRCGIILVSGRVDD